MVDKKTTEENTRSPIDGTELVRLATSSDNWKTTIDAALDANWETSRSSFSGTELVRVSGVSSNNWKAPVSNVLDANWETLRSSFSGTELVRVTGVSSQNWKAPVSSVLDANWETSRSSLSGTELVRITGDSSNNWKTTVNAIIGSNWETTLNPITGTETVRLTDTSSVNWKGTVSKVLDAPHPVENLTTTTFAALPPAAQASGAIVRISDSPETHLGYIVSAGGGGNNVQVQSDGISWRVFGAGGRRVACGTVTLFISPTGNDTTGDGSAAFPFRTMNRAWTELVGVGTGAGIDGNGFQINFQLTDGTHDYSGGVALDLTQEWVGGSDLYIQGNVANPEAVIIRNIGGAGDLVAISVNSQRTGKVVVQNLTFDNWHVNVWAGWYDSGVIWAINLVHRNGPNANHFEVASMDTHMSVFGTDKISTTGAGAALANSHFYVRQGGRLHYFATTLNIDDAAQNFGVAYARLQDPGSVLIYEPPVRTGTYHGAGWRILSGATIDIWGNANWTPGDPTTAIYSEGLLPSLIDADGSLLYARDAGLYANVSGRRSVYQVDFIAPDGPYRYTSLASYNETSSDPNDLISTYELRLPRVQGLPGAHLENDGSGNLSWVDGMVVSSANLNFYLSKLSGTIVGGSSYNNGSYSSVALTGGSGTGARASIIVEGNAVTLVKPSFQGSSYAIGDALSAPSSILGSSGAGFTFTLTAIGSDSVSNTGQSSSAPFATIGRVLQEAVKYDYDFSYNPSIWPADGIYDEGLAITLPSLANANGLPSIRGRSSRPESVEFYVTGDVMAAGNGSWSAWGLRLTSEVFGGGAIALQDGYFETYDMEFNCIDDCLIATGNGIIYCERPRVVNAQSSVLPKGLARLIHPGSHGLIYGAVTIDNAWDIPATTWAAFVNCYAGSILNLGSTQFIGSSQVTGRQYLFAENSLYTGVAPNTLPGTTGGTISPAALINGAVYDFVTSLSTGVIPTVDNYMMFERITSTQVNLVLRGSDSVIRRGSITLSSS